MAINPLIRNIFEIGFGIIFLISAVFNTLYTYRNGEEFYGSFADKALLIPAKKLIENVVIPRNKLFTILMVAFLLSLAISILSRGPLVGPGLIAGALFAFGAVFVSNRGGMIVNLVMAVILFFLGFTH
jgi:hypothetical protein